MLFPMGTAPAVGSARGTRWPREFRNLEIHTRLLRPVAAKVAAPTGVAVDVPETGVFFTTEGWRAMEATGRMREWLFSVDFCYLEVVGALVSGKHFVPNVSIRHARGRRA